MYAMRIEYFLAKNLQYMFIKHISRDATITTNRYTFNFVLYHKYLYHSKNLAYFLFL